MGSICGGFCIDYSVKNYPVINMSQTPSHIVDRSPPRLSLLFKASVTVDPPIEYGVDNGLRRRFVPILGGSVSGKLVGQVLPGGGDWQSVREADGFTSVHARYSVKMDDGQVIGIVNEGIRRGPPDVMARLIRGEQVDPALYYFITTPRFEVGGGKYSFLRESIFTCCGVRQRDCVHIWVYELGMA